MPIERTDHERRDEVRDLGLRCAFDSLDVLRLEPERLAADKEALDELTAVAYVHRLLALLLRVAVQSLRDEFARLRILNPNRRSRGADDAGGLRHGALEHIAQPLGRRELACKLEQRLRALGFAPLCLVETRILECDGRVAGEHLEQPQVVRVELVEAELGDDDRSDHARPVVQRHSQERLVDRLRARDRLRELTLRGVAGEDRVTSGHDVAGDAGAHLDLQHVHRPRGRRRKVTAKGDRHHVVAVDHEHAAVVVIDQRPQLVRDHVADLAHVVEAVELAAQALQHLHVRDRTHVARARD